MRLATRIFLWTFLPAAVLLTTSFWTVARLVNVAARSEARRSLREEQTTLAHMAANSEDNGRRELAVLTENAALKTGMSLVQTEPDRREAQLTVEDQLIEVGSASSFSLLFVFDAAGRPLAGAVRENGTLVPLPENEAPVPDAGVVITHGRVFRMVFATVLQSGEILGRLAAGDEVRASDSGLAEVLEHDGKVLQSSVAGVSTGALESFLRRCAGVQECEGNLAGESYVAMSMGGIAPDSGYAVRSLRSLDAATRPMQARLRSLFLWAAGAGLILAVAVCILASRSVARPIERLVAHLRRCEASGDLSEFHADPQAAGEVLALTQTFSRAAASVKQSSLHLRRAYVESVQLLASALDARDPYTAGHSARVSQLSCAIAKGLRASDEEFETTRIGALLHDIGKIGIADAVLQKPGKLTHDEYELLKKHPSIGRHILEGVDEFHRYLPVVELHHENWDGSGYPHGQRANETPRPARIVHVADAFDAMTSDRPYRKGMDMDQAIAEVQKWAGKQFDPAIVAVFVKLLQSSPARGDSGDDAFASSLLRLAEAVDANNVPEPSGRRA